jgi:hypothetical protein
MRIESLLSEILAACPSIKGHLPSIARVCSLGALRGYMQQHLASGGRDSRGPLNAKRLEDIA